MKTKVRPDVVCYMCQQETPASASRYIARYDIDLCHVCFMAWN